MDKIDSFKKNYFFLSNFYPVNIVWDGRLYKSSEHLYQASKTNDDVEHMWVRSAPTAGIAKKRGQLVTVVPNWDKIKIIVMHQTPMAKFQQHDDLKEKLLETGDALLEEGNNWGDTYWGTVNGVGEKMLGKLLMGVREHLK